MKISDLDVETRRVIIVARIVSKFPSTENLERLTAALKLYDEKYAAEQERNLLHGMW